MMLVQAVIREDDSETLVCFYTENQIHCDYIFIL